MPLLLNGIIRLLYDQCSGDKVIISTFSIFFFAFFLCSIVASCLVGIFPLRVERSQAWKWLPRSSRTACSILSNVFIATMDCRVTTDFLLESHRYWKVFKNGMEKNTTITLTLTNPHTGSHLLRCLQERETASLCLFLLICTFTHSIFCMYTVYVFLYFDSWWFTRFRFFATCRESVLEIGVKASNNLIRGFDTRA